MRAAALSAVAWAGAAFVATGASEAQAAEVGGAYRLVGVETSIAPDASIDWNAPDDPAYELQDAFIKAIFDAGATDGAAEALLGPRPATLRITVTRFDILSTWELFFCCAVNEVDAIYELVDAETGAVVVAPRSVSFDHIGRGGLVAAISAAEGRDQLQRLADIIREGTTDWLLDAPDLPDG